MIPEEWKQDIIKEMSKFNESPSNIQSSITNDKQQPPHRKPFTIWTKNRIYFSSTENVKSILRHQNYILSSGNNNLGDSR